MNVTVEDLRSKLEAGSLIQLVDVRSASEHSSAHIPGAVNIPMDQIEGRLADLNKRGPVVLVCHSGSRAGMTCELLQGKHQELHVLEGGTQAWIEAGLPTVSSSKVRWSIERQVRLTVGVLLLLSITLGLTVNINWIILAAFLGAGLTFAGITDFCGMAFVYSKMPWNRPSQTTVTSCSQS